MLMKPDSHEVERLVRMALEEDAPWGDITSPTLIPAAAPMRAHFRAREDGVLCGEDIFATAMSFTGPVRTSFFVHDGDSFRSGDCLAEVSGPARAVLQAERVALNFVQRLSGIATLTARYVAATVGTKARILDTRKTTPRLRVLERYAVRCGGGFNHRFSLSDAFMAKDNHLAVFVRHSGDDFRHSLRSTLAQLPHTVHVEVEVDRLDQIEDVLYAQVDTIMLDNFSLADLRAGVQMIGGRARVEASGGITLERVAEISATGVDFISVGALTHSVASLDLGLDM